MPAISLVETPGARLIDGSDINTIIAAVNALAAGTTSGVYTGTFNGVVGGVTPAAGSFTTLSASTGYNGIIGNSAPAAASVTTFSLGGTMTIADAINIVLNATTGTKIGTATTQKIAFYNSTPVVQPAGAAVTTAGFTAGSGAAVLVDSTFTGNTGSTAYHISDIVANLKSLGLLAA